LAAEDDANLTSSTRPLLPVTGVTTQGRVLPFVSPLSNCGSRNLATGPPGPVSTTSASTVNYRIVALEPVMPTAARFDLKMDADEKAIVAKAAALLGTTMAGFVRVAAKEKAQVLLDREARLTLTDRDFTAFARALDSAFAPNPALKAALTQVRRRVRRA
jgi:uncharacterized protein (DUF1778 family)